MVSISLPITKCSVTHNQVMNIRDFLEYTLKSSKCGPHASKMKSWILYRPRSTQKYPHFEDFFCRPKMAEISNLLSHFNTMCHNICVKPDEGYNLLGAFESALCQSNHFVISKRLFLKGIWLKLFQFEEGAVYNGVFQCEKNPKKGTTQHASRHNVNGSLLRIWKRNIRNFIYSKEQISILARKFPWRLLESVPGRLCFSELFVASIG